jgi:transcription-repair coupling factor (superfamily II helicase)
VTLTGLLDVLLDSDAGDRALRSAVAAARAGSRSELDLTAPAGLRPVVVGALPLRADRPVLAVTATGREAEDLVAALSSLVPGSASRCSRPGRRCRTSG